MRTDAPRGLSLVESLVALALLGFVLLSVGTLFVLGARELNGGRAESVALWAAHDVMESVLAGSYRSTWERFDTTGTATSLSLGAGDSPDWTDRLVRLDQTLPGARIQVQIEGIEPGNGSPAPLSGAPVLRLTVEVLWRRGRLERSVRLVTVRT
jgi:type II secretory pathway pseudopilin PulG